MLDLSKYGRPAAVNAPGYFWFLNAELTEEGIREQLRDFYRCGARSVCPHPFPKGFRDYFMSNMSPDYLTDGYFEKYKVILDECHKLGMNCYLYDEGGWPSGGACGHVYEKNPEAFRRKMVVYDKDSECGYKIVEEAVAPGKCALPDILVKGATETFLEVTHQQYFDRMGEYFGKNIHFAFTDEPAMMSCNFTRMTWTDGLGEEFKARKGYAIEPYLKGLLLHEDRPELAQARIDFLDVTSQLFTERYTIPIRDWCRAHRIKSGGHVSAEDEINTFMFKDFGHVLRTLRTLDQPGVDLIWRQLWPGKRLHPFPKFASSVAHQGGHKAVMGELFGVYGNGLTFDQMRFIVDYMVLCGVNSMVFGCRPYSTAGGGMEGERPHFGPLNPQWWTIKPFHEYVARLSHLSTEAKPEVRTALFLDVRTLWSIYRHAQYSAVQQLELAERLQSRQVDFDYIDDDVLATASLEHGRLKIGCASYEQLVVPMNANLAPEARKTLERIKAAGFPVYTGDESSSARPTLVERHGDWRLRVRKHRRANGDVLYFVMNISSCTVVGSFQAEEAWPVARCDSYAGKVYEVSGSGDGAWSWTFAPYSMSVFLLSRDMCGALPAPAVPGAQSLVLSAGWKLRPVRHTVVGENDYVTEACGGRAKAVKLGDWKGVLGEDFSGEAEYSVSFDGAAAEGAHFIDLGDVKYSASVCLNGRSLGTRVFPPYVFEVGDSLQPGANKLTVRVINTLANAIAPQRVLDKWLKQFPFKSPYEDRQRGYERESLPSGLFGPVTLRK